MHILPTAPLRPLKPAAIPVTIDTYIAPENHLLSGLPTQEWQALAPHFHEERLLRGSELFEPGSTPRKIYFPISAIVSTVRDMGEGRIVEVDNVGDEGVVPAIANSLPVTTTGRAMVQVEGRALSIDTAELLELLSASKALREMMDRYLLARLGRVEQLAACNCVHSVEQRCARWLSIMHRRVGTNEFPLTQESLGLLLAVRRASVSVAMANLRRLGVIRYTRNRVAIVNPEALQQLSCECYRTITEEYNRLAFSAASAH